MTTKLFHNKYSVPQDTKFVIDYDCTDFCYKLVRFRDDAILYSNEDINEVTKFCWINGIDFMDTAII